MAIFLAWLTVAVVTTVVALRFSGLSTEAQDKKHESVIFVGCTCLLLVATFVASGLLAETDWSTTIAIGLSALVAVCYRFKKSK